MAGYAYVNPLAGLIPHAPLSLSPYVMAGYAYVNPLAGLIPHAPLSLSPYVMAGYAYINPLAGLTSPSRLDPTMLWQVMLTSTP